MNRATTKAEGGIPPPRGRNLLRRFAGPPGEHPQGDGEGKGAEDRLIGKSPKIIYTSKLLIL